MSESLQIGHSTSYKLHPLVIFNILDHFKRRDKEQKRVIGTLMGKNLGNVVIITNCFPLVHVENEDQITFDLEHRQSLFQLHKKVNVNEVVVGWYAAGAEMNFCSSQVQHLFQSYIENPIHLTVDTRLTKSKMDIKCFVASTIEYQGTKVLTRFEETPIELEAYDAEKIALDALINGKPEDEDDLDSAVIIPSEFDFLVSDYAVFTEMSLSSLLDQIETISEYVEGVINGEEKADENVGRKICQALTIIPRIEPKVFENMLNSNLQDFLMIMYLASLTRTQLAVAEKSSRK